MEDLITKARNYAMIKHMGQTRGDGSPYIFHPLRVSQYLEISCQRKDENLIAAGALHDVIEDCNVSYETLKKEFNKDIADLVLEVTKVKPDKKTAAYFPHLKTWRGKILKFFDRADNIADHGGWDDEKMEWYLSQSKFWRDAIDDPIYHLNKEGFRIEVKKLWNKLRSNYIKQEPIKGQITVDEAIHKEECKGFECKICSKCSEHAIHYNHEPIKVLHT